MATRTDTTEPIRLRYKKLKNGSTAIYLVTRQKSNDPNRNRVYEHLGLFLIPETTKEARQQNKNTKQAANAIKAQRILDLANGKANIKQTEPKSKMRLIDWMEQFRLIKLQQGQSKSNAVTVNNLMLHLRAYKGEDVTLGQVDKKFLEGFIAYLSTAKTFQRNQFQKKPKVETEKKQKPLSERTIYDIHGTFMKMLEAAKERRVSKSNSLMGWLNQFCDEKEQSGTSRSRVAALRNVVRRVEMYSPEDVTLKDANKPFCNGFLSFLHTSPYFPTRVKEPKKVEKKTKELPPLSATTATLYYNTFVCALNEAVKSELIETNPANKVSKEVKKPIKAGENSRTYLTIEELKMLLEAACPNEQLKKAFIFACFCGLRISDIQKLTWGEIRKEGDQWKVITTMLKTRKSIHVPLSESAMNWLPERGDAPDDALVFSKLPAQTGINQDIKIWAKRAGITNKNVTFHTSRHTFATTALTLGADLYTTSKLLGHQNIRVTQVYAEIVNQKKNDAVNLFNGLLD